jgi:hypothetical protein
MTPRDLEKKLDALLKQAGPADLLAALRRVIMRQLSDTRPPGGEEVPELEDWRDFAEGELADAAQEAIDLEDDIGYPPYDQRLAPKNQGRGGVIEAVFPWLRR